MNRANGQLTPITVQGLPDPFYSPQTVEVVDQQLYLSDGYTTVVVDRRTNQVLRTLEVTGSYGLHKVVPLGQRVFLGGFFSNAPPIVAYDRATAQLLNWIPDLPADSILSDLQSDRTHLFALVIENPYTNQTVQIYRINPLTGASTPLSTAVSANPPYQMAVCGSTIYLAGSFLFFQGQQRAGLAAIESTSGTLLPWVPILNLTTQQIRCGNGVVYIIGMPPIDVGELPNQRIIAVGQDDGIVLPWRVDLAPMQAYGVYGTIEGSGSELIVFGSLNAVNRVPVSGWRCSAMRLCLAINSH